MKKTKIFIFLFSGFFLLQFHCVSLQKIDLNLLEKEKLPPQFKPGDIYKYKMNNYFNKSHHFVGTGMPPLYRFVQEEIYEVIGYLNYEGREAIHINAKSFINDSILVSNRTAYIDKIDGNILFYDDTFYDSAIYTTYGDKWVAKLTGDGIGIFENWMLLLKEYVEFERKIDYIEYENQKYDRKSATKGIKFGIIGYYKYKLIDKGQAVKKTGIQRIRVVGTTTIKGVKCFVVELKTIVPDWPTLTFYIDIEKRIAIKINYFAGRIKTIYFDR